MRWLRRADSRPVRRWWPRRLGGAAQESAPRPDRAAGGEGGVVLGFGDGSRLNLPPGSALARPFTRLAAELTRREAGGPASDRCGGAGR